MTELAKVFKALSDTNRIRILKMLERRSLCVCEITEILELATSTVSKHLSILRDAELIVDKKEGKWVNFNINNDQNNEYVRHLLPLIRTWLPSDAVVLDDKQKVQSVNRNTVCGIQ
jgi:ArsR family transcriptional regulator